MKKTTQTWMAAAAMMMAAFSFSVTSCNTEDVEPDTPFIEVDQTAVAVPSGGGEVILTVTANRPWALSDNTAGDRWIIADKTTGEGNAVITLTVSPNTGVERTVDLQIATSTVYAAVRITQPGAVATEAIYADDFGNAATASPWPSVDEYTGWNKSGAGAASVTYAAEGGAVSVRNNSNSTGYTEASGQCNVMMAAAGASFLIKNINPSGMTHMMLSFGSNETNTILKLFYSTDGTAWTEVAYEKTAEAWGLVSATFDIPAGSNQLHLKYTAGTTTYGTRVDDVKLTGSSGAPSGDLNVSPTSLSFVVAGEDKQFTITSTKDWTITSSETWCSVTPASGNGNATVTVDVPANTGAQRTATITVKTTDNMTTKTVAVTQDGVSIGSSSIWYEDVGKTNVGSNTDVDTHTGWSKEGSGGSSVAYAGTNTTVRTSVPSAGMYDGASGGNEVFFGASGANFTASNITLSNVETATLTFGISKVKYDSGNKWDAIETGDITLSYSTNGGASWTVADWSLISAPATGSTVTWALATTGIPTSGATALALKWDCTVASAVRLDDMKLVAGGTVTPPPAPSSILTVNPSSLSVAAAGEAQTFTIASNTAWTVTSSESWCTPSTTTGSNNAVITVTAAANTGSQRAATITVQTTDNAVTRTVTVTQAGVTPDGNTSISATWDFKDLTPGVWAVDNSPCTISPTITGSIIIEENLTQSGFSKGSTAAGKSWGGSTFTANTAENVATTNIYATVKFKSATKNISLSTLSGNIRRSGTGPTNTAVFYKIGDGAFVAGPDINNGTNTAGAGNDISASLSAITALQNIPAGTVVTIKLVPYGASADGGTWYLNSGGNPTTAFKIEGTEQ